ncbi:MAG TPA: hypothetical protein VMV46_23550 [Thermoanaerobaculia bacterium]|nr:hypothetical protein [Thermoanaerobaculia bacterium]
MNATQQARLILGLGLAAAVAAAFAAWSGRGVEPAGGSLLGEQGSSHVIWGLAAMLVQLLVQSWIAMFGLGSLRLLGPRRRDRRAASVARAVIAGPLALAALFAIAVATGIRSYSAALPSPVHGAVGWMLTALSVAVLAWEWRALERLDGLVEEADGAAGDAPGPTAAPASPAGGPRV